MQTNQKIRFNITAGKNILRYTIASAFSLSLNFANADVNGVQKYRNYTPKQIAAMPEEARHKELPLIYLWAAEKGISPGAELVFSRELSRLMYPGISNYKQAIKDFQTDLGDDPNGILTVRQIHELTERSEMQSLGRISFPNRFFSFITSDFGHVEGTMIIHDDQIADPINHQVLSCNKRAKICELQEIILSTPKRNSFAQTYSILQGQKLFYEITKWDAENIEASSDSDSACRQTSVTLNFRTKEFYFITRNGTKNCDVLGTMLPKLTKPRIAQIVDGKEIINNEFGKVQLAAFRVTSKSFQAKVEDSIAKEKARK